MSVASASQRTSRKARPMDEAIVSAYVARLEAALGDDPAFMAIFRDLSADRAVKQAEAVGILSRFIAPAASGTSKRIALERILGRHQSLHTFKLKRAAIGGRSAA